MKTALIWAAGIAGFFGLIWLLAFNSLGLQSFFAPRQEAVRRETFEQSKAYRQGMVQELQNMQFQYTAADTEHKAALAAIILHRAADFDESALPPDLYQFIQSLKGNIQ